MFKHNRDSFGGGLCMYVNESVPVKQVNSHKDDVVKVFPRNKPPFEKMDNIRCI